MKLLIKTSQYRDRTLLIELFDLAVETYKQHAVDANLDDRLKEQFLKQANRGGDLTLQMWHQASKHDISFFDMDGEADRWLLLNMVETGVDILTRVTEDVKLGIAKVQYLQKVARGNQLREMIEDAGFTD